MAEYRGLTIRIGADTGSLTASLRAAQSAMSAAQKQANILKRALVLDPGNKNAAAMYIGELQSQMVAATSKMRSLKQEIETIGGTSLKTAFGGTIEQLAKQTDNAALKARRAKEAYAEVTKVLAEMYTELTALSKEAFNKDGKVFNHENNDIDAIIAEYHKLAKERPDLVSEEDAEAAIGRIRALKAMFQTLSDSYDDAAMVEKLHNDEVAAANLEAKMHALAEALADATRSDLSVELENDAKATERLAQGAELAKERLANIDTKLSFDPSDLDTISSKTSALTDLQDALRVKLESVRSAMDKLEDAGVDKAASSMANLAESTERARQEFVEAEERVVSIQSRIDEANELQDSMRANANASSEAFQAISEELSGELYPALENAQKTLEEAETNYQHLKDANTFAELENQAEALSNEMREVTSQMLELQRSDLSLSLDDERADLEGITAEAEAAKQRFEALNKALELNPTSIDLAVERSEALTEAQDKARQRVEKLRDIISKLEDAGLGNAVKDTESLTNSIREAEGNFKRASNSVNVVEQKLDAALRKQLELEKSGDTLGDDYKNACDDVDRFTNELADAAREAHNASEQVKHLRSASELVSSKGAMADALSAEGEIIAQGKLATGELTTAMFQSMQEIGQYSRQAIQEIVTASYDLEEAFTNMTKTVDGTDEQYNQLKESAVQASMVNPVSADQILNVEALGGQLGFAIDELDEFQRVANGLDISTNMGWEDAATNMAQFANIMKMDHDDIGRYGSAIVDLGNNFATTEADISDMAMRIAGAGASLGLTEADVLGLSTALTSMGLTAEAGGSSISQIMLKVDKAVANGADNIKQFASDAGMSVDDFVQRVKTLDDDALNDFAKSFDMSGEELRKSTADAYDQLQLWAETAGYDTADKFASAWKESPIKALQDVFTGLGKTVENSGDDVGNLSLILDDLNIKTIRQGDVARRLANNHGLLVDAVKAADKAWEDDIALTTEVERRNQSLSGRMDVLKNAFTAIKTEMGEGLKPFVEAGIAIFTGLVDVLDKIPAPVKSAAIGLLGLVTALAAVGTAGVAAEAVIERIQVGFMKVAGTALTPLTNGIVSVGSKLVTAAIQAGGFVAAFAPVIAIAATIGTLAAVVGYFGKQAYDAHKRAVEFGSAIDGVNKNTKRLSESATVGASNMEVLTSSFKAMSVKELSDDLNAFSDRVGSIMDSTKESNGMLGDYLAVLQHFAGAGEATAADMAKIEWALDGVNEAFQTNYTAEDILVNKYSAEGEEIDNLIGHISDLISKRQEQAEMAASQDIYTEYVKEEKKLQAEYDKTQKRYNELLESNLKSHPGATEEDLLDPMKWNLPELQSAHETLMDLARALREVGEGKEFAEQGMEDVILKYSEEAQKMKDIATNAYKGVDISWADALKRNNIELEQFSTAALNAGISAQDLQTILDDPNVFFAEMVEESGGNLEKLIEIIQRYNDEHVEPKEITEEGAEQTKEAVEEATEAVEEADGKNATYGISEEGAEETKATVNETTETVEGADGTEANYKLESEGGEEAREEATSTKETVESSSATAKFTYESEGGDAVKEENAEISEAAADDKHVEVTITATNEAGPVIEEIQGQLAALAETSAAIPITATNEAGPVIDELNGQLLTLSESSAVVTMSAIDEATPVVTESIGVIAEMTAAIEPVPLTVDTTEYDQKLEAAQQLIDSLRQNNVPTLRANNSSLISAVQSAQSAINGLTGKTVYVYVDVDMSEISIAESRIASLAARASSVSVPASRNAAGGIRYHADGFIADRPTWISRRDIVGEAGAEAIIPLTNKKYVDPFAGAVADQMLHKMHGMEGGNNITVQLNYQAGDDANKMARDLARALGRIQRTGR